MTKKILICDDEEGIRESLKLILENHYPLIVAESSTACLDILKNGKDIELVLLDIRMPKVNGLEVLGEIKKKHPRVKVVMITGYKCVETAAEASRLGASGYITKPFKAEEILEAAKKNIEK